MTFAFEPTLMTILKLEVIVFVVRKDPLGFSSLEEVNGISGWPLLPPFDCFGFRYTNLMWLFFLIGHLYLSGLQQC